MNIIYYKLYIYNTHTGHISIMEKRALTLFRHEHHITADEHIHILTEFGWTEDDYISGIRPDFRASGMGTGGAGGGSEDGSFSTLESVKQLLHRLIEKI